MNEIRHNIPLSKRDQEWADEGVDAEDCRMREMWIYCDRSPANKQYRTAYDLMRHALVVGLQEIESRIAQMESVDNE